MKKILVIKLGALGDFIQATGPMKAIREHHPNDHLTLLTTKPYFSLGQSCGYFNEVLIDVKPRFYEPLKWLKLASFFNKAQYDRVYDLQNNDRTSFYFKLFRPAPEWVGTAKSASHRNTSPLRTAGHAFDGHVQTLALAGITDIQIDDLQWMDGDFDISDIQAPYIVIAAGCAPDRPEKRWSPDNYGQLAKNLSDMGYTPVLIGTDAEKKENQRIKQICAEAIDLTGKTKLGDIVKLGRHAAMAIGNDTGPMHMMAPTGCPALVLFSGSSDPVRHAPKGNYVTTLQKDNINDIRVNSVTENLEGLLKNQDMAGQ